MPVKEPSSRAAGFTEAHGNHLYELEAFEPDQLQRIIRDAIRDLLDLNLFAEEQRESEDARYLMAFRKPVREHVRDCRPDELVNPPSHRTPSPAATHGWLRRWLGGGSRSSSGPRCFGVSGWSERRSSG
jgi:hypothetical protein